MQDHDACLLDFEQQPAMHERSHARRAMHMSCHQAFRLPMPRRRRARFRWLPMHFYGRGGRNPSWSFVGDATCTVHCKAIVELSIFPKIYRCQSRCHRALLISAIVNRR